MNSNLMLRRVVVRLPPMILGVYLAGRIAQVAERLTGSATSQLAWPAVIALILGLYMLWWAYSKEFKISIALSIALYFLGTLLAAFGISFLLYAWIL